MKRIKILIGLLAVMATGNLFARQYAQEHPEAHFCRYENGQWLFCGKTRDWWDLNHEGHWDKYSRSSRWEKFGPQTRWNERVPFSRRSEQDLTAGFEMATYNSDR